MEEYTPYITNKLVDRGHARRMGNIENYFALWQRQELYNTFHVYGEINKPINKLELGNALRPILMKNPLLLHYIVPKHYPNHEKYYTSEEYMIKPCPINDYIRVLDSIDLEDIVINYQREYNEITNKIIDEYRKSGYKFTSDLIGLTCTINIHICDPTKPSWRLLCLPQEGNDTSWSKFIYITNHCGSDGTSGVNLIHDISKEMNKKNSIQVTEIDGKTNLVTYANDYKNISKLAIPFTDRIEYRPALHKLPSFFARSLIKSKLVYTSPGAIPTRRDDKVQTFDRLLNFTTDEVETIKVCIKENIHKNATLTPFLQACLLISMYKFGEVFQNRWNEWGIDLALPTNERKSLPDDEEIREAYRYGPNVGGIHYFYLISSFNIRNEEKTKFWTLVKNFYEWYQTGYKNGDALIGFGVLISDFVVNNKNMDTVICDDLLKNRRGGVLLSNVGFFPQDKEKEYFVNDLVFGQAPGAMRFTFGVNICSTNVKGMNIAMGAVKDALKDDKSFGQLCTEFRRTISNFVDM